ncbi:MAG: glycosyltransferase [Bacteroidia bacterium]
MKIVFFSTYYDKYLDSFYTKHPEFLALSYADQIENLKNDYFGVFGSYVNHANRLGHEAVLIVPNCESMQKTWAKEHKFDYSENGWEREIALEQIKAYGPDVFFMSSLFHYYGDFLKKARPYCRKLFGWIACPVPEGIQLNQMDLILTSVPELVNSFRSQGVNSELLPAAFDPDVLKRIDRSVKQDIDFSFIAGFSNAHTKRKLLTEGLIRETGLTLFGYGLSGDNSLKGKLKSLIAPDPVLKRYKGEVWGLKMFETLFRSKITFNAHIDMALGNRVNMRMYEATGMGTLLLTDKSEENGKQYFSEDKEIVSYTCLEDAIEKVHYYLSHEEERKAIAKSGQERTLKSYSFNENMPVMLSYFSKYM